MALAPLALGAAERGHAATRLLVDEQELGRHVQQRLQVRLELRQRHALVDQRLDLPLGRADADADVDDRRLALGRHLRRRVSPLSVFPSLRETLILRRITLKKCRLAPAEVASSSPSRTSSST